MKALITGINGFVGKYLAEYLQNKNIEVFGTVHENFNECSINNIKILKMDITESDQVETVILKLRPDYIIHLAAQSSAAISWKQPQLTMDVNINGTINLLEAIRKLDYDPRVLLIGSSEEYGHVEVMDNPINESYRLQPGNPYSVSKIAQNMMGQLYSKVYDMDIMIVRSFNHIGPGQAPVFVVSDFAKRIAEIEKGIIEPVLKVGNLEAERDFTDVRDVVRAYYDLLIKGEKGEIYNVGSGVSHRIKYLLDRLLLLTTSEITVEQDPKRMRPLDVPIVKCDNSKLNELTGWNPRYDIGVTLSEILTFWRDSV